MSPFAWAAVTAAIWGTVPLLEKIGLAAMPSAGLGLMVRTMGVAAGLLLFGWLWPPGEAVRQGGWGMAALLALAGFLANFVGQLTFYQALKAGTISQIIPIVGTYPLIAATLGWCVLREPLTLARAAGVACIVAGVVLLKR